MELSLIKDYIANFQKLKFGEILERELKIKPIKNKATTIIGPRRAGKTFFFFWQIDKLPRNEVMYLDFEEPFLRNLKSTEVLKLIFETYPEVVGNTPKHIFLDEVQNLKDWQSLTRSLLNRGLDVFLTGSSSKLLSKEIATQLRGRSLSFILLPFSFREFLNSKHIKPDLNSLESIGKLKKALLNYLHTGGFPEIVLGKEKEKVIKEYLDLAFFKDFIERHEIKSTSLARYLFNHLLQNFSTELSIRSIERKLRSMGIKFNITTLYKYVEDLEDTLFIFFLRKFSWKPHEKESWPRKVYVCDTSLVEQFKVGISTGKLMENVVFLEYLRSTNERPLLEILYWKGPQQKEVDFVIKEGLKIKQLVQVTYASSMDEIEKRELKALVAASKELKCNNLLVITWDYEAEEKFENKKIKFIPLWKWLLKKH